MLTLSRFRRTVCSRFRAAPTFRRFTTRKLIGVILAVVAVVNGFLRTRYILERALAARYSPFKTVGYAGKADVYHAGYEAGYTCRCTRYRSLREPEIRKSPFDIDIRAQTGITLAAYICTWYSLFTHRTDTPRSLFLQMIDHLLQILNLQL